MRHAGRIGPGFGGINGQHAVDLAVLAGRLDGDPVVFGRGLFGQVNQVRQRGLRRQQRPQSDERFGRELAKLQENFIDPVCRQNAGPATVSDNGQPLADRAVARRQALGRRKQRHERAHAHSAGAAQGGVKHVVASDNGAAVGLRRFVAGRFATRLEHDHRLGVGG